MNYDFKITINNEYNTAASILNCNEGTDIKPYTVSKHCKYDGISGVTVCRSAVTNTSDTAFRLNRISSLFVKDIAADFHKKDILIHFCRFTWQGEAQWQSFTPYELGIYPVSRHAISHIDKTIANIGSWSTHKYYPIIIIENKTDEAACFFELAAGSGWSFELGTAYENGVCSLTLDCTAHNENIDGFYRTLKPGETFETAEVLHGTAAGFDGAILKLLSFKRQNGKKTGITPVCFNDYMNCLWAEPERNKLISLRGAAKAVGAEVFCIDDGWFIRNNENTDFGDWLENDSIFGSGGLKGIIDLIASNGMKPGLWFELETAYSKAAITRIAPDAVLTRGGIPIGKERQFLNFRCPAVTEYLYSRIQHFYNMGIRYIKNDYNHSVGIGCDGENCSFSAAFADNLKAFYAFSERLLSDMPELIIENCASGAMRCDFDTLRHFHLQSVSDQEICTNNPSIIRGMLGCIPPEKLGIWSYPFPTAFSEKGNAGLYNAEYLAERQNGAETVFNMCCAFFGIMTLSGRIDKCDDYNLELIKKGVNAYKASRSFLNGALPVFIGGNQKLFTEGWCALALKNGNRLRVGIFRCGGESTAEFELPPEFANGKIEELYPCTSQNAELSNGRLIFSTDEKICARVYEISAPGSGARI